MPIPHNLSVPMRVSAKERALAQIQDWIVDGTLEGGEKLNDAELAQVLGMSRTPIREALQALAHDGFVEMRPGRETRVAPIDPTTIDRLYPPLAALDAVAAETAAKSINAASVDQLRALNQQLADSIAKRDTFAALEADEQFHNVIVDLADNPYLTPLVATLHRHVRRLRYTFFRDVSASAFADASVSEHAAIIKALEAGDAGEAGRLMRQNWLRPMDEMRAFWGKQSISGEPADG